MTLESHPLNQPKRPMIITRPQERVAQQVGMVLLYGRPSFRLKGSGRAGKTTSATTLRRTFKWRPYNIGFLRMIAGNPNQHTESNIMREMALGIGLKGARNANPQELLARIIRAIEEEAGRAEADLVIFIVDSSEKLTLEDYEHIAKLHDHFDNDLRLFFLFVCQDDHKFGGADELASLAPPHIYGRYFVDPYVFTGLLWEVPEDERKEQSSCDVALALREYDEGLRWPTQDSPSATETFAPVAFANGWRLEHERDAIFNEIQLLCAREELAIPRDWLMATFEVFIYHILVHVAARRPDFSGLSREDIRQGLQACAFAAYEHARQRVRK
ncbi:ATP-binding protein [Stenotrophomonas acidaminiphila]|uniref:ATP-binding protein n=1 Tax=Stenotrophomonas acidaminiphila TaxID=128780 RepID=UPI0028A98796|nr:ATP-binding protein [Stenotrophomonas acidaminiphila]